MTAPEKPLHKGNRTKCIACGAGPATQGDPFVDMFTRIPKEGVWSGRVCNTKFKDEGCSEARDHLHQTCGSCYYAWIVGFVGEEE